MTSSSALFGKTTSSPSLRHLHKIFEKKCAANEVSGRRALIYNDEVTSFSTLNQTANQMGRMMVKKARQIHPFRSNKDNDYVIAVCMSPSDKLITTLFAILKSGAAYVPIDPTFPESRITHIIEDSEPLFIISDYTLENKERELFEKMLPIYLYGQLLSEASQMLQNNLDVAEMLPVPLDIEMGNRIAIVLYTSGSSGIPKGVRLPHRVVLNRLMWQWRVFPYNSTDMECFKTVFTFVDSVSEIFAPTLKGLPILIVPKTTTQNPQELLESLEKWRISRLILVPSLLRNLFRAIDARVSEQRPLPQLRFCLCGGESVPTDLLDSFFKYFIDGHTIVNVYGCTEVMGDVTYQVFNCHEDIEKYVSGGKVSLGNCVDNTTIYLLEGDTMKQTPEGELGEIFVSGASLSAGYVGIPISEKFIPLPEVQESSDFLFKTGDYGRFINQQLYYEGRVDSQIKVRGHRVDLAEIERILQNHYAVEKAVVLCYKSRSPEQNVLAYYTAPSGNLTEGQAISAMMDALPPYMVPDHVFLLNTIPLLINGKTDRQLLLKKFEEHIEKVRSNVKAKIDYSSIPKDLDDYGHILLETVAAVLGPAVKDHLSLRNTFFEAGGNSLNSILMVTKLRDRGFMINVAEFILAKSLEEVARKMQLQKTMKKTQFHGSATERSSGETVNSCISEEDEFSYLTTEMLSSYHFNDVTRVISGSFSQNGDLEKWTKGTYDDFANLIEQVWDPILREDLSFVLKNRSGKIIGVSLNFDAANGKPHANHTKPIQDVCDLLEFVESSQRSRVPLGKGKVLYGYMMGTDLDLSSAENIIAVKFMEEEILRLTKYKGMIGVMMLNLNPLTQQICEDLHEYEILSTFQVNRFVAPDGTKPFEEAPDSQTVVCCYKNISNYNF